MIERLNDLALMALDTLEEAMDKPGSLSVNAAKVVLEWKHKLTEQEEILTRLAELERNMVDKEV